MPDTSTRRAGEAAPAERSGAPRRAAAGAARCPAIRLVLWAYTATTFLSALLLFSVQPMFAKMVLPVLGGSPSVWAVAIFFFQAALLAGYCYAHFLIARVPAPTTGVDPPRRVRRWHSLALPIGLPAGWSEPPPGEPYLWQIGLFTVAIGLPFLAVAANAPLLQAWFARTGHPHGARSLFPLRGQQSRQPDRAARLSVRAGAGVRPQGAEPAVDAGLPAAGRWRWRWPSC